MDATVYQRRTDETAIYSQAVDELLAPIADYIPPEDTVTLNHLVRVRDMLNYYYVVLGLVGEAGELANKAKKWVRDGELDQSSTFDELGDVSWYLARITSFWGWSLGKVFSANLWKLGLRKQRGVLKGSGDDR